MCKQTGHKQNDSQVKLVFLGPVHKYPEIFVSANFFMRIHLASTRVRRIRSKYPEISIYAIQSGNFCICSASGYMWMPVPIYFGICWRHSLLTNPLRCPDTCGWSYTICICYVWMQIFLYLHKKICGYKNLWIHVDGALEDTFHTTFCKGVFISFEVDLIMNY